MAVSPRARRPTMRDVADAAGVSFKTVSRAINGEPGVSPETSARVLEAIAQLGFRRNDMARDLRAGHTSSTIGLVIGDVSNPFYSAIARSVEVVARRHAVLVVTASSEEDPIRERELIDALCGRRVDGLVIVPAGTDHRYLRPEMAMGTKAVFLDRPGGVGVKADSVLLDNSGGAAQAVRSLADAGHRRIAVLGDRPDIYTMQARIDGFRAAMVDVGLPIDERLIAMNLHSPVDADDAATAMLERDDPPSAFFPINNRMTVGVVRAVWRRHADVAIVGFDDFELADLMPVPFKVVAADPAEMGRLGAELLFERIAGSGNRRVRQLVVGTRLLERGIGPRAPEDLNGASTVAAATRLPTRRSGAPRGASRDGATR